MKRRPASLPVRKKAASKPRGGGDRGKAKKGFAGYDIDNLYKVLIENSSDIIAIVSSKGDIEFISPSIKRILGSDPKALVGNKITGHIHPDDVANVKGLFGKALQSPGKISFGEFRIRLPDGSFRTLDGIGKSLKDRSGRLHVIANAHDISDKKRAEEELKQKDEIYRTIADAAHDMIFMIGKNDAIEYINAFGASQLRKKPEDLIGKPRHSVFPAYVNRSQEKSLKLVFDTGVPHYFSNEIPFPTGKKVLDTWLVPVKDDSGKTKSVYGISRDATATRMAQDELRKQSEESYESSKRAQMYFDFLAHDIANIVSPILLYSEAIRENRNVPPEVAEFSARIEELSRQMASFIHNLRMLAEAEKTPPETSDIIDIRPIFDDVVKSFAKQQPNVKIVLNLPPEGKICVIGGTHIKNAFMLGVQHSIKSVRRPSITVEMKAVPVKKSDGTSFWQIRIQVPGAAIPIEAKRLMETPFDPAKRYQRKAAGELSFAISIFEHFGGKLWSEDLSPKDPSKGFSVVMELPRCTHWSSEHST